MVEGDGGKEFMFTMDIFQCFTSSIFGVTYYQASSNGHGFNANRTKPLSHGLTVYWFQKIINGLDVPKTFNGLVWFGFSINGSISVRFGSKTWVYRFTIEVENSVNKLLTELSTSLVGNRFKYWYFKSFDMKTVNPYPYVLMIFLFELWI